LDKVIAFHDLGSWSFQSFRVQGIHQLFKTKSWIMDYDCLFLLRDALYCKAWSWDCMSSICLTVCLSLWRWWIMTT